MWENNDSFTEVRHFRQLQALLATPEVAVWQPPPRPPLPLLNLTPPQERQVERLLALIGRGDVLETMPEPSPAPPRPYLPSLTQIVWWLERYGTWCWLGVWLAGLLAGGLAVGVLWDPDFSQQVDLYRATSPALDEESAPVGSSGWEPVEATLTPSLTVFGESPEWLFAGVALSCAAGAFVMSRWLDEQDD